MEKYNDEINLKDVLIKLSEYREFLLAKKMSIIVFFFLCVMIGALSSLVLDTRYQADLSFVVEEDSPNALGSMSGIASQFGFDVGGQGNLFSQSNIFELLKSRGVIVRALMQSTKVEGKEDLLIEHYLKINKIRNKWSDCRDLSVISFHNNTSHTHDSIKGVVWKQIIEDDLSIRLQSDDANIITLSYSSLNQEFAKAFVQELIMEMSKMYISHKTSQANSTLDFLQCRADSVFLELEIAEQEFAKVQDVNRRIIKAKGRLQELQLRRKVEVLNAMYLEIVKNMELSKLTLLNKTPIINIVDKPILPLAEDKIGMLLGSILGGFLGGFLSLFYFIFRKFFTDALKAS